MNPALSNKARHPWWLKLIAFGLLILSITGWLRLGQTLARWEALEAAGLHPGPVYLAISGTLFGLGGLVAAAAVWRRSRAAPRLALLVVTIWVVWLWVDRVWISVSATALSNAAFLAGASVIILAGTLYAMRRGKDYFQ